MDRPTNYAPGRAVRALVGLLGLTLLATGCAPAEPGAGPQPGQSPKSGGTLTYLWGSTDASADLFPDTAPAGGGPQFGNGVVERYAIYEGLVVLDTKGELDYRLAQSMESADGAVWTLKLRANAVFSDGTPFDAAAVKFNWSRAADPATKSPLAVNAGKVAAMDVVDAQTLKVTLKTADRQFPRLVAQTGLSFIGSPTAMQSAGAAFGTAPVGAGPYLLKEWKRGELITFERNPRYYGQPPYLDTIVYRYVADPAQRYNTLVSGGADVIESQDWSTVKQSRDAGYVADISSQNGGFNVQFNTARAPFDNRDARLAIAYAIDPKALNDTLYAGQAELATTLFKDDSPLYSPVNQLAPDKTKAQELFDKLAAAGTPLSFTLVAPPGSVDAVVQWMQAWLANYKNVTMKVVTDAGIARTVATGAFDATILPSPRFVDPFPQLTNWLSTGGSSNFIKFSDPQLDAALTSGQTGSDTAARKAAYAQAAKIIADQVPVLFLYRVPNQAIYKSTVVGGFPVVNDGLPDWARIWKQ